MPQNISCIRSTTEESTRLGSDVQWIMMMIFCGSWSITTTNSQNSLIIGLVGFMSKATSDGIGGIFHIIRSWTSYPRDCCGGIRWSAITRNLRYSRTRAICSAPGRSGHWCYDEEKPWNESRRLGMVITFTSGLANVSDFDETQSQFQCEQPTILEQMCSGYVCYSITASAQTEKNEE